VLTQIPTDFEPARTFDAHRWVEKIVPTTSLDYEYIMETKAMRTKQTPTPEGGEVFTLQQVVDTMGALQSENC